MHCNIGNENEPSDSKPYRQAQANGDPLVKRKTTHITVTTEEVWVVHKAQLIAEQWCESCAAQVRMVSAQGAAALAKVSARAIYRAVESQQLHFKETSDGRLFICLNSLPLVSNATVRQKAIDKPPEAQ